MMSKTPICGIYYIKNTINNKYYVGQALNIERRWRREKYELNCEEQAWNIHLQRAWYKYGSDNFEFTVIEECSAEQLDEREKFWISFYDSYNNGYNQSLGGGGVRGWKHTEETRALMSESNKKNITPERRKRMSEKSNQYWGKVENREHLSIVKKQWWADPDNQKKMAEATKNSDRIYLSGEEHPMYGKDRTGVNSGHHKSCIQIETGMFYYTLTEASKQTGTNLSKICDVCNGRRKTAGRFHWRYATDEEIARYLEELGAAI